MIRSLFILYLTDNGCIVIRTDKSGYLVTRNVINMKMSGVPYGDTLRSATVCRICKTLDIEPPEEAKKAAELIELIHNKHLEM